MYLEKRPTCVTVIGWVWCILGGWACLAGIFGIAISSSMMASFSSNRPMPAMIKYWPILCVIQLCLGAFGLIAGIHFLKLKAWARTALETLTWLLVAWVVGFTIFWEYFILIVKEIPNSSSPEFAIMGFVGMLVYGIPLFIMLKTLRGERVRMAIRGIPDVSASS